jgi:signal transduction histidine kinase
VFRVKNTSLRFQLLLLLVTVAVPLVGLVGFAAYLDVKQTNQSAYDTVAGLSQLTAAHVEQLLTDSEMLLAEIAQRPQVRALDPEQCDLFLPEIPRLFTQYAGMTVVDRSGEVYCAVVEDGAVSTRPRTSVADRPWFQEVMVHERFAVSEALVSRIHGRWVTVLAYPIYDLDGELGGVLTVSLHLVRYQAALERISLPTGSTITIVDGEGKVLARSEEAAETVGMDARHHDIVRQALEHDLLLTRAAGIDGVEKLFGVTAVSGVNWKVFAGIPLSVAYAPVRSNLLQLGAVALAIVLAVSLLALYLIRSIEAPARTLAQVAADVADSQFDRRAPTDGPEEFRLVALQFNRMLEANNHSRAELQNYAHRLQEVNGELESFAYSVSHDLRAPLRAMSGFSRLLGEEYRDQLDETGQHYLNRIDAAGKQMGNLIEDLLRLSRLNRTEMICTRVNLSRMAAEIIADLKQRYPERSIDVSILENCEVTGDAALLRIALENILENAWKFTARVEQARVEFGCCPGASGENIYYVSDNGAGFDMAYADKLFGAFQRLHTNKEFPGTGIGLATVQRAIHRHQGSVWAEAAVDNGATFYFTLPQV